MYIRRGRNINGATQKRCERDGRIQGNVDIYMRIWRS